MDDIQFFVMKFQNVTGLFSELSTWRKCQRCREHDTAGVQRGEHWPSRPSTLGEIRTLAHELWDFRPVTCFPKPRTLHLWNGSTETTLWWGRGSTCAWTLSTLPGTRYMCPNFSFTKITNISVFHETFYKSEYSFIRSPWNSDTAITVVFYLFIILQVLSGCLVCVYWKFPTNRNFTKPILAFIFDTLVWFLHSIQYPSHSDLYSGQLIS